VLREDEDRKRREAMMLEEERLKREKEALDDRYQKELTERQFAYECILLFYLNFLRRIAR
jgi:hypothetical protein